MPLERKSDLESTLYRVSFRDMEIGELNSEEHRFRAAQRAV
jgi:hypothetical protein